jgi:hypothetical protein
MDRITFKKSGEFIADRNVSDRVLRVVITFEQHEGRLRVVYCLRGEPTEEDCEDCELTCAELVAEFPEIKMAETRCIPISEYVISDNDIGEVVFSRS